MRRLSPYLLIGALASGALTASGAQAGVIFCNEFPHTAFFAIAYPQESGIWLSRGWLEVPTGECRPFDTALRPSAFYWRGETEEYVLEGKSVTMSWGNKGDRSFAVWEDDNFQYYDAEHQILNSTLEGFVKGIDGAGETDVTVTITPAGVPVEKRPGTGQ